MRAELSLVYLNSGDALRLGFKAVVCLLLT